MIPTTAIVLDTRRSRKDGSYPVKLRVTYARKRRYYGVDLQMSEEDWTKVNGEKPRGNLKDYRLIIDSVLRSADEKISEMKQFSFYEFEKIFYKVSNNLDLSVRYESYISKLKSEKRIGTALNYKDSISSLLKFKSHLSVLDITPQFLNNYERWMINNLKSSTTVGIYLRCLRAIMKEAIFEGIIKEQQYPFGRNMYQIPAGQNIKKALSMDDIEKILNYPALPGTTEDKSKDFWVFSYLCNGANIADICRLKYKNIQDDKIVFIRAKTARTSRKHKPIVAHLSEEMKVIISKWGNKPELSESYIFSILNEKLDATEEKKKIRQFIKTIDKYMKRIAVNTGINTPITTIFARHSFSTVLKRGGAPHSFIGDSLGHTNYQTTENYLASFDDKQLVEFAGLLLPGSKSKP